MELTGPPRVSRKAVILVVAALVAITLTAAGFYEYWREPVLKNVSCRLVGAAGVDVSGDIYNPSFVGRSFAVRPTYGMADGTQGFATMRLYVSVPARSTRHFSIKGGSPASHGHIATCSPSAYGAAKPSDD